MVQALDETSAGRQVTTVAGPHAKPVEDMPQAGSDSHHIGSCDGWPVFVRLLLWATRTNHRAGRQP